MGSTSVREAQPNLIAAALDEHAFAGTGYAVLGSHYNIAKHRRPQRLLLAVRRELDEIGIVALNLLPESFAHEEPIDRQPFGITHEFSIVGVREVEFHSVVDQYVDYECGLEKVAMPPAQCSVDTSSGGPCPINEFVPAEGYRGKLVVWKLGAQTLRLQQLAYITSGSALGS